MKTMDEPHSADECLGGTGWVGDVHGGQPWEPCHVHWPKESVDRGSFDGGPREEYVTMTPDEAEAMFPGFFKGRSG